MDISKKVQNIISTLNERGYIKEANYIEESEKIGGTGGEIFDILIGRLLELKNENSFVYSIVKTDAESILSYAKGIGRCF